jgi:hypothetical protein
MVLKLGVIPELLLSDLKIVFKKIAKLELGQSDYFCGLGEFIRADVFYKIGNFGKNERKCPKFGSP